MIVSSPVNADGNRLLFLSCPLLQECNTVTLSCSCEPFCFVSQDFCAVLIDSAGEAMFESVSSVDAEYALIWNQPVITVNNVPTKYNTK